MKKFVNYYLCKNCDVKWHDTWTCACDDKCPACGYSISPHHTEVSQRESSILTFCDGDLQLVGIEPEKLTDEQFEEVTDSLRDYFNENFLSVLQEMTEKYKSVPSFLVGKNDRWGRIG